MDVSSNFLQRVDIMRNLLNAAAGGAFMNRTEETAFKLLEDMSRNNEGGGGWIGYLEEESTKLKC